MESSGEAERWRRSEEGPQEASLVQVTYFLLIWVVDTLMFIFPLSLLYMFKSFHSKYF